MGKSLVAQRNNRTKRFKVFSFAVAKTWREGHVCCWYFCVGDYELYFWVSVLFLVTGLINARIYRTIHHIEDYYWFTMSSFVFRGVEALGTSAYSNAVFVLILEIFPHNGGAVRVIQSQSKQNHNINYFLLLGFNGDLRRAGPKRGTSPGRATLLGKSPPWCCFAPSSIINIFRKIGGFGLPFYVIGVGMVLLAPLNMIVIPKIESNRFSTAQKNTFLKFFCRSTIK